MRPSTLLTGFLRARPLPAIAACFSLFTSGLLGVLLPLSIGAFFGAAMGAGGGKGKLLALLGIDAQGPTAFFPLFAGLVLLLALSTYAAHRLSAGLAERFATHLQTRLFSAQLHGSLTTHRERPVGSYLLRYSGDLRGARDLLRKGVLQAIGDAFLLVAAYAAMAWLDLRLAGIAVLAFLLSLAGVGLLGRPLARVGQERRDRRSRVLAFVTERLNAFRTIKSFNRETPETRAFERLLARAGRSDTRYEAWNGLVQAITPVLYYASLGLVLLTAAQETGGARRTPDLLAFTLVMLYTRGPIRRLLRVDAVWRSGLSSLRKLAAIAERPTETRSGAELPADLKGEVCFADVHFAYPDGTAVLEGLSAVFPANAITRLAGPGGSGRSTVLALVQRIHSPTAGTIRIDGIDIATLSPFAIRRETTLVSDEAPLLGDTVLEAVVYRAKDGDAEKAVRTLRKLDIALGPDEAATLAYPLQEGAANLSRGQRRMLQIARALLTRKTILLLDEPFQDLGAADRDRVVALLNDLRTKRTIIIASNDPPAGLRIDHTVNLPCT